MDIPVLDPSELVKEEHDGINHHPIHMETGNIVDMAFIMGFYREPTLDGRVFFGQGGHGPEKIQDKGCIGRPGILHFYCGLGKSAAPGAGCGNGFVPVKKRPDQRHQDHHGKENNCF